MVLNFMYFALLIYFNLLIKMPGDSLEDRLRDALQRSTTELNNYRLLYRQSQFENQNLQQIAKDLDEENSDLVRNNRLLNEASEVKDTKIEVLEKRLAEYTVPKVYKSWEDIKSRSQKYLRKMKYRKCISLVLRNLPDVVSANVDLEVGADWVNLKFSSADLDSETGLGPSLKTIRQVIDEHNYSTFVLPDDLESDEEQELTSESFSDILVSSGQIGKRHVRCIVNILDLYKIPQKGYNDLRLACKGILPTLSSVAKERFLMSNKIPYIRSATVS